MQTSAITICLNEHLVECMRLVLTEVCVEKDELFALVAVEGYLSLEYRGPLSIMSHSQSRSEDIVAHRHSRDFRMWCTVCSRLLPGAL